MDNDGHLDFVAAGPNGIWISYGRANGTFDTGSVFESGSVVGYATVADFNNDGIPDVVTSGDIQLHLRLGKGDGTFLPPTTLPTAGGIDFSTPLSPLNAYILHGDFNGGGKQDILAIGSPSIYEYNFYRLNGHGDGTFDPPVNVSVGSPPPNYNWEVYAVEDFNNDGRDDLAISYGTTLVVNLAQPSGDFVSVSTALTPPTTYRVPSTPAYGDLDKDGKLDVAYTNGQDVYVLFGHGDGTFTQGAALLVPKVNGSYAQFGGPAAIGDFDGDGNSDIAVLIPWAHNEFDITEYPTQLFTYYGDGKGGFSAAVPGPTLFRPYSNLLSKDLDLDGRDDLIFDNGGDLYAIAIGPAIGIAHGNADRTLGSEINYVAGTGLSSIFVTDLNRDHFPDILAANGDYNETANSFTVLLNLGNAPSVTGSLTAQPEPSQLGQTFQVTASLSPPPGTHAQLTGNISFSMDGAALGSPTLSNNSATITVSSKPVVGTHALSATWLGDANYAPVTLTGSHVVIGLPSTTSLSASPNPAYALQSVILTASVTAAGGAPTGTVTFLDGGATLGSAPLNASGSAALTVHFTSAGNHAVKAVYSGDATFNTSTSSSLTENVLINPSDTTLNVPFSPVLAFQPASLLATVLSPNAVKFALSASPSGTVTFYDGPTDLGSSAVNDTFATLNTASFAAGTHSLTAIYSGDSAFSGSTSSVFTLQVLPDKSRTTLSVSPNTAPVGTRITFDALVTIPRVVPTGTVVFYEGATALGSSSLDSKGSATFSTSTLSVGQHSISASYTGSVNFEPSTSSAVEVTITPFVGDFAIDVDPSSASIYTAQSGTFRVTTAGTGGFNQNLTLSCSGLPAESSCTFDPGSINGGTGNAKLTIQTTAPHPITTAQTAWHFPWQGAVAILLLPRRIRRRGLLLFVLAIVAAGGAFGCGAPGPVTGGTPPGTYNVQVTATASQSGQTLAHSATIKLTVKSLF